jgi:Cu/Ag efflux protein CusF
MKFTHILAALAATAAVAGAHAQSAPPAGAEHATHQATTSAPQVDAEVRKIDTEQGKVTLRHGPIPNLDMPNMTMVFRVTEPKMLEAIKEGDKVKFTADKINGAFTVTSIQVAN